MDRQIDIWRTGRRPIAAQGLRTQILHQPQLTLQKGEFDSRIGSTDRGHQGRVDPTERDKQR